MGIPGWAITPYLPDADSIFLLCILKQVEHFTTIFFAHQLHMWSNTLQKALHFSWLNVDGDM
jgi:hypothetical protein